MSLEDNAGGHESKQHRSFRQWRRASCRSSVVGPFALLRAAPAVPSYSRGLRRLAPCGPYAVRSLRPFPRVARLQATPAQGRCDVDDAWPDSESCLELQLIRCGRIELTVCHR